MKKLLAILSAVGLTATASTSVVSCTTVNKTITDLTVSNSGLVTFKINDLKPNKNYDNAAALAKDYAIFNTDKDNTIYTKDVTFTSTTQSIKKNKKVTLTASFQLKKWDSSASYSFVVGSVKKGDKLDSNLGTLTIVGAPKPATPKVYKVSGNFKATFKATPTPDQMKDWFAIKDASGNTIDGVTYKFTADSKSEAYVALNSVSDGESGVTGTVSFSYDAKVAPKDGQKLDIDHSKAGDNVTNCPSQTNPVTSTTDKVETMTVDQFGKTYSAHIWVAKAVAGEEADKDTAREIWGNLFDIRSNGNEPADSAGNKACKDNFDSQDGADNFKVKFVSVDENAGTAVIDITMVKPMMGYMDSEAPKFVTFTGEGKVNTKLTITGVPATGKNIALSMPATDFAGGNKILDTQSKIWDALGSDNQAILRDKLGITSANDDDNHMCIAVVSGSTKAVDGITLANLKPGDKIVDSSSLVQGTTDSDFDSVAKGGTFYLIVVNTNTAFGKNVQKKDMIPTVTFFLTVA